MGHLDQFAKLTFAEETEAVTGGAVVWQAAPEIGLTEVRGDGLLVVRDPSRLTSLAWPWAAARDFDEILIELKMQGDHLDARALERTLLRRQARQVQRVEAEEPPWLGQMPVWLSAPSMPHFLPQVREVSAVAPGCYRVGPSSFTFLWIAANELPLCEELIPFLVARSGRALVELLHWVVRQRPAAWVLRMLEIVPMPLSVQEEFERYLAPVPRDDPEIRERGNNLTRMMLKHHPEVEEELIEKGVEKGLQPFSRLIERRLGRALTLEEHQALTERFDRVGPDRLADMLELSAEDLAAWLASPTAT